MKIIINNVLIITYALSVLNLNAILIQLLL